MFHFFKKALSSGNQEYLKPISVRDEAGTFHLNRHYDWFEGQLSWLGHTEEVLLDTDGDGNTAASALETLRLLLADGELADADIEG